MPISPSRSTSDVLCRTERAGLPGAAALIGSLPGPGRQRGPTDCPDAAGPAGWCGGGAPVRRRARARSHAPHDPLVAHLRPVWQPRRDVPVVRDHGDCGAPRVSKIRPRVVPIPYGSRPSICPVRAWQAWKEAANLTDPDGYAWRRLHNRWHTVLQGGLAPESIGDIVTRAGERAGIEIRFTGHSPRRGLATSSRLKGHDEQFPVTTGYPLNDGSLRAPALSQR
ncbi:hypothetical protein SCANM63S_04383 [Streptomyces canarius]